MSYKQTYHCMGTLTYRYPAQFRTSFQLALKLHDMSAAVVKQPTEWSAVCGFHCRVTCMHAFQLMAKLVQDLLSVAQQTWLHKVHGI